MIDQAQCPLCLEMIKWGLAEYDYDGKNDERKEEAILDHFIKHVRERYPDMTLNMCGVDVDW